MTAEPLPLTTPGEPPSWTHIEAGPTTAGYAVLHCIGCAAEIYEGYAQMVRIGPELEEIRLALCEDCASAIAVCVEQSTEQQLIELGAVIVRVMFAPRDSPLEAEVLVRPEPANVAAEVDILELAALRLTAYSEAYGAAARAEDDEEPAL